MNADGPSKSVLQPTFIVIGIILFGVLFLVGHILEPIPPGSRGNVPMKGYSSAMLNSILFYLQKYADDHDGHYPEGKSSTEVFQHLIDEGYVTDPTIFCAGNWNVHGLVPPQSNHLKPENVCWDITGSADPSAPEGLPLVFLSGFKVTYQPGSRAVPLHPIPQPPWYEWLKGGYVTRPFITFSYRDGTSSEGVSIRTLDLDPDGSIPNFIPANFDPKGKVYRQLTPTGELPP